METHAYTTYTNETYCVSLNNTLHLKLMFTENYTIVHNWIKQNIKNNFSNF